MKNIIENPFLGEAWLPVAQVLLALHEKRIDDTVMIHAYAGSTPEPTIKVNYLSNGEVIMTASANSDLRRHLRYEHYQSLEFVGFLVPKNEHGVITIEPEQVSDACNPKFVRIFKDGESTEQIVELTIQLLALIYEVWPTFRFYFGAAKGQHEFVHSLGILNRFAATEGNPQGAIFAVKGSCPDELLYDDKENSING